MLSLTPARGPAAFNVTCHAGIEAFAYPSASVRNFRTGDVTSLPA